jgi:ornithine cyclodeaminase
MIPHLTASQLRAALPYDALISALRVAFVADIESPRRHVHQIAPQENTVMLLMPVWQPQHHAGMKLVTVAPGNAALGLPTVHSIFMLLDSATGAPLALMDGEELTLRRTAAASALASQYLSRPESRRLLLVGTGSLAPRMAAAHCVARGIEEVAVWGRSFEKAQRIAAQLQEELSGRGVRVRASADLEGEARAADIISCATTSTEPILRGDWIAPGTHIDLVGGFRPEMREADDALLARASVFVDTHAGALAEAGDLLQPLASGALKREAIRAELAQLCGGAHPGRNDSGEITVFKSVGAALEDLCAADLAWASHQSHKADISLPTAGK